MEFQLVHPISILYVADTETSFGQIALPLLYTGHALATATDQATALESIGSHPCDVVLIELSDPEANLALVRAIHQHDRDLPAIVIAPPQPYDAIEQGLGAGAYDWQVQPVSVPLIELALRRAAERRRFARKHADQGGTWNEDLLHKVNNQLSSNMGLAQLHSLDTELPHELIQDLEVIIESARHIRDLLSSGANEQ